MPTLPLLVSPVLVGRDHLLQAVSERLASDDAGRARLLFLAGEAGIGKTRLLGAVERRAVAAGYRVVRGLTFPRDLEVPAAPILDLARAMTAAPDLADVGRHLEDRLAGADAEPGDAHRRRRLLTLDAVELLLEAAARGRILVALEDLHWADELTLEILAALASRETGVPLLVVGTYRSDELYPRLPMREWRGLLVHRRLAQELRLERLTLAETEVVVTLLQGGGDPASSDLVERLHDRSDGIPLHLEELVALMREAALAGQPDAVPGTLETAIADRLALRSAAARRVAAAGAVIGRSFEVSLLARVLDLPSEALEAPLAELRDHFFLVGGAGRLDFRHALIRDAIHRRLTGPERRRLHGRVADLAADGDAQLSDAALSLHLEEAGRRDATYAAALRAARASTGMNSTREALGLYRRALANLPPGVAPAEHAALLAEAARAAAAADENGEAVVRFEEARARFLDGGDTAAAAAVLPPLVAARHLLGDPLGARTALLSGGLADLEALPDTPGIAGVRAALHGGLAAAYMLDRRLDEGLAHAEAAAHAPAGAIDEETELDRRTTLGALLVFARGTEEGWRLLEAAAAAARAARLEAPAARAYRMLGSSASVLVEYQRGEGWLREGVEYAERVEHWNHRHYMAAHLAHVLWATGRVEEARGLATHALADGRGGITTRITALHVLGYAALSSGDAAGARAHLAEALELGEGMGELQRYSPALWGLAEVELLEGRPREASEWCRRGRDASLALRDAAYLYPFAVTGVRVQLALADPEGAASWLGTIRPIIAGRAIPGTLPALDHADGLIALAGGATGRAVEALAHAARDWGARGRTWEGTAARLDLATCHLRANRPAEAARIATAVLDEGGAGHAVLAARARDVARLARGRAGDPEPWAPLSAREFGVARLVMAGRTNREIAEDLGISPRTVSAHVEHILDKLGLARRSEVAAWASTVTAGGTDGRDGSEA